MSNSKGKKHLVKGEWLTIYEACKKYGHTSGKIRNRMYDKGMTLEEALEYIPKPIGRNEGSKEWQNLGKNKNKRLRVDDV